jgi:hypothetical protein
MVVVDRISLYPFQKEGVVFAKPTLQERIRGYLDAIPPAIAYSDGHKQTFKVACLLYNGWALTVDETIAWAQGLQRQVPTALER